MRYSRLIGLALLAVAALAVAGCTGGGAVQTWPGMTTDGQVAYLATGQQVKAVRLGATPQEFTQLWSFPTAADRNIGTFVSEPGTSPDVIVVGSEGPAQSYSGVLFGLDPATGQQRWCLAFDKKAVDRHAQACPLAAGVEAPPQLGPVTLGAAVDNRIIGGITITDGVAYFGLANGSVYAVDTTTGRDVWHFDQTERDVWASPLVANDTVYVAALDHHVYYLDRATGQARQAIDMGAAVAGTPTLDGDTLYVGTFGRRLVALDATSGEQRWDFPTNDWVWTGPTVFEGVLYFTDVAGNVYAVDANTHALVWPAAVKPGGQMRGRPLVNDQFVYIGDRTGSLFALNRADGSLQRTDKLKGQLTMSPLLARDLILVAPFGGDDLLAAYNTQLDRQWAIPVSK